MATSFIGKSIALLSHSDVRYRGILAGLDPLNSTIQLQNVYSMGTERRRPPEEFIPPAEQPYQYIIFRASEVKDLALDNDAPVRPRSVHDDPAVIGAVRPPPKEQFEPDDQFQGAAGAAGVPANLGARPPPQQVPPIVAAAAVAAAATAAPLPPSVPSANGVPAVPEQPQAKRAAVQQKQQRQGDAEAADAAATAAATTGRASAVNRMANASVNSVHSATQSLENVERALGDLRLQNAQAGTTGGGRGGGGRRNGGGGRNNNNNSNNNHGHPPMTIPTTEFDFESANARFKKTSGRKTSVVSADGDESDSRTNPSDEDDDAESKTSSSKAAKDDKAAAAYNPKASFFDSLSSSALPAEGGGRGGRGRGRGRGNGRSRREEERERNFATFGEAGGVGLMGPDAYVGGYGGYGRGRRGGGGRGGRGRGPRRGVPLSVGGDQ